MDLRLGLGTVHPLLSCACAAPVIVKSTDAPDVDKIRNRVVLINRTTGEVSAVCKSCGDSVTLPLRPIDPGPDLYLDK